MAKFDMEQTMAVAAIQQLINDWAYDLDVNNGLSIRDLVTEDCTYAVGPAPREGREEVGAFYAARMERLTAQGGDFPVQRHLLSNLRVSFHAVDAASITFNLLYFSNAGMAAGVSHPDPVAVADVRMDCRRTAEGHWAIATFDSAQCFRRTPA
ncbi:MAG TPA: nuclear transport factor 2 family protein [Sphingobium sp.]|uniref:nuclear transport factor 2 family protein n=1 Tax=Sphingobium sp. TaxID=1912891 RepID=UPI002ED0E37E